MALRLKSSGLGSKKGWILEPIRHGLARKGICTGTKTSSINENGNAVPILIPAPDKNEDREIDRKLLMMGTEESAEFEMKRSKIIKQKEKDENKLIKQKEKNEKDNKLQELIVKSKLLPENKQQKLVEKIRIKHELELDKQRGIQREKLKEGLRKVGRGIKRGLSKAVGIAESVTPQRPRSRVNIDVLGKRGVTFKKFDIDAEIKRKQEAKERAKRTIFIKQI